MAVALLGTILNQYILSGEVNFWIMAKKAKEVKSEEKLSLENLESGMIIPDLHDEDVEITDDLIEQMRRFEKDTKKSAIWRNKITGSFLYFKWLEENPQEKVFLRDIKEPAPMFVGGLPLIKNTQIASPVG